MLAKNFKKYFLDEDSLVASYEWIRDLFQDTPEGLSTSEEEIFIDFTCSEKIKGNFCNKSLFEFGVEVGLFPSDGVTLLRNIAAACAYVPESFTSGSIATGSIRRRKDTRLR
ncbi:uncharacterized protein TNCV_4392801 [Trichonephila clavipes]|nr:uncharacterized protein TNCV_4392801 [Trichonephila clavipes]